MKHGDPMTMAAPLTSEKVEEGGPIECVLYKTPG
jgi:hypothetical protein